MALLWRVKLLPTLRTVDGDTLRQDMSLLVDAGLSVVELTAGPPGWEMALATVRAEHPEVVLGAGGVRDVEDVERAAAAGARFLATQWPASVVREAAGRARLPLLEGGWTPAEMASAVGYGPAKLFPAHVGGVPYLRSLLPLLPNAAIVPSGGIGLAEAPEWLDAGALAVGVGGDLLDDLRRDPLGTGQRVAEVTEHRTAVPT